MNDYQKEYIEFRLIILGDSKVGKKSFIERLLNISSTSIIRNKELELQYKKLIYQLRKKYEKHKKFLENLQPLDKKSRKKEEFIKRLNDKTSRSSKSLLETESKITETKEFNKIEEENSFILKVTSDEQYFSKKYVRPPIPEHPAKLFNIHKSKIIIKPYYILPPEKIDYDYNPDIDDSENELDTEFNVSLKGIKSDVKKIILNKRTLIEEEKLKGYKINIYNIFLFLYDMSDFNTFEMISKYYTLLEKTFKISEMENSILYIIGNKKDKKILLDLEQITNLNAFLKKSNFIFYEISTRSYFNFDKFFIEFILKSLSKDHQELIKEDNFKSELEKIAFNKPTFSKSKREIYQKKDTYIGPKYYANIYGFDSSKELSESFNNEKMRFNKKIFCNKTGPKYVKSKSTKDINININNMSNNLIKLQPEIFETKGGLLNKPVKGYKFGIVNGKLDLLKIRKKLILERNVNLKDSIEEGSSLFTQNVNNTFKSKGEDYLEEAEKRRRKIYERKLRDKKVILDEIKKLHLINLEKIEKENNKKKEKILLSQSKNTHSLSFPDLFTSSNYNYTSNINNTKENEEEMNKTSPKNYIDIIHPKNKQNLDEYYLILKRIQLNRKKDIQTPGPNAYDIRNNFLDKNKGFTITGKRKEITKDIIDPSFPDLKDEFDIIVSKAINNNNNKVIYSPRFKKIEKEKDRGPYPNEEIWKKWELNKTEIDKNKMSYFVDNLKEKKKNQIKKVDLIKKQTEEIARLRKEILIRKGYEDPGEIKSINFTQVETASPKYSIKGRHPPKIKEEQEKIQNQIISQNINSDQDLMNYYIQNQELFRPLPNANFVKPKLPTVVFGKAERFDSNKEYQGPVNLFPDGIFALKTHENFCSKSPYDNQSQRNSFKNNKEKSPSPADYKIKSEFEIIAEKGKKLSEIRDKIKIREMIRNFRNNKINEKRYVKIKKIKKINEEKNNNQKNDDDNYLEGNDNIVIVEPEENI